MTRAAASAVSCVLSIDVEEEGLFRGVYQRTPTTRNVAHLRRLADLFRDHDQPLTLLTAYPVTQDDAACAVLRELHDTCGAEIGAHLHHWNTPPLVELPHPDPVPSRLVPEDLLRQKLQVLTAAIEERLGVRPRSFRMGRFDFHPALPRLLGELGYVVDSSLVPLRSERNGPDQFTCLAAPSDLGHGVRELPLTVLPLWPAAARLAAGVARRLPTGMRIRFQRGVSKVLATGIHPLWYPLPSMQLATRLHLARGGTLLNIFLHSSELMPGGSPQVPDEAAALRLADKLRAYLDWLHRAYPGRVQGRTLTAAAATT